MVLSCGAFIEVGDQDDVEGHVIVEPVETGSYPLRIVGVFVRERVSLIQQRAGEVQLAATCGKGAMSVPREDDGYHGRGCHDESHGRYLHAPARGLPIGHFFTKQVAFSVHSSHPDESTAPASEPPCSTENTRSIPLDDQVGLHSCG